jgi:DNA-binding transcriptional ArsR family regulator
MLVIRRSQIVSEHRTMNAAVSEAELLSGIAMAIGEPARTRILLSLLDGHARTSTELAALAEVSASTASAHLNRLREARLVHVAAQGRHRYYSLRSPHVARVLEDLGVLAGRTRKNFVPSTPASLRKARSCYDHMAGAVAVALLDQFLRERWLMRDPSHGADAYKLSNTGAVTIASLGIDVAEIKGLRRRFAFACLDWSERRPHIGGALGAALLTHAVARKWVVRDLASRALCLTRLGEKDLLTHLGVSSNASLLKAVPLLLPLRTTENGQRTSPQFVNMILSSSKERPCPQPRHPPPPPPPPSPS